MEDKLEGSDRVLNSSDLSCTSYFEMLPEHILENILRCLPDRDLSPIVCLNTTVFRLINKIVKSNFMRTIGEIERELIFLEGEIRRLSLNQTGLLLRIFDFRSHVALEFLISEMLLMKSLGRGVLYSDDKSYLFARINTEYREVLNKAKERNLPRLKVNDDLINKIVNPSKLLINQMKGYNLAKSYRIPLGTKILDLMNCLLKKEFNVVVKFCFHQTFEFVVVEGTYQFVPLNLYSPPPTVTRNSDEREKTLSHPDDSLTTILIDYLFNVIRLNNKSYLKEASYEREEEFNNRRQSLAILQHGPGVPLSPPLRWLNQHPTSYSEKDFTLQKSFRQEESSFWIKHTYLSKNYNGVLTLNRKGRLGVQVSGLHHV